MRRPSPLRPTCSPTHTRPPTSGHSPNTPTRRTFTRPRARLHVTRAHRRRRRPRIQSVWVDPRHRGNRRCGTQRPRHPRRSLPRRPARHTTRFLSLGHRCPLRPPRPTGPPPRSPRRQAVNLAHPSYSDSARRAAPWPDNCLLPPRHDRISLLQHSHLSSLTTPGPPPRRRRPTLFKNVILNKWLADDNIGFIGIQEVRHRGAGPPPVRPAVIGARQRR